MAINVPVNNVGVEPVEFNNDPLPEGWKTLVTILPSNKEGNTINTRPYAKQGANVNVPALAIRVEIADGQKGKGRNLFADIPLVRNFAPNGNPKFPDGAPAYSYFGFFRALGFNVDGPSGLQIQDERELIGKQFEAQLTIDTSGNEPRNEIRFFNQSKGIPVNTPALIAKAALPYVAGGANAAPATPAAAAWSPPGTPAAGAPVAGAPAQQQPVAGTAPWSPNTPAATAPGAWAPDPADVEFAAAATAGKGF